MQSTGAYTAERASALSGVPKSTIHYWARNDVLVPSVSAQKVKLWSYADLMGLRVIYWLRQTKTDVAGAELPATSMRVIRKALGKLAALGEPLWHPDKASIWVDVEGDVVVKGPGGPERAEGGQRLLAETLNLIAPFESREGLRGPDLAKPRAEVRIVPGKLSGSPHILGTRLETQALYALTRDGYSLETIRSFYPTVREDQIDEALDLERQLEKNLSFRSAA